MAAILALLGAVAPAGACACGIALQATVPQERGLVVWRPNHREQIVTSLDLVRSGKRPAVVFPVPGDPAVAAIAGADPLAYLDVATAPPPPTEPSGGSGSAGASAPPVQVLGRATVGGYDVTRLRARDPHALSRWLASHGYRQPAGSAAGLADYVAEGWRFVAIRLAPGSSGRLRPLRISFASAQPVYPLRLSRIATAPLSLEVYVVAAGPMAVDGAQGLDTVWPGRISALHPIRPASLAGLLPSGAYVTKVSASSIAPEQVQGDLIARAVPAASSAYGEGSASAGVAGALNAAAVAAARAGAGR